jgi:hypothetical protein
VANERSIPWPKWRWEGSGWWQTIAASILAAAALIVPALMTKPLFARTALLIGAFVVVPLVVLTITYIARALRVMVLRALAYESVVRKTIEMQDELTATKTMLSSAVRGQHQLPTFEITKVLKYGGYVYVNLSLGLDSLSSSDRIALVDTADGMVLGDFEVTDVKQSGYQAKSTRPPNPVWLGYLRESSQMELPPPPGAVALRSEGSEK